MVPRIAASSRSIAADPSKAAEIGPSFTVIVPLALWASCSVSATPRHAATSGMSAKITPDFRWRLADDEALLEARPAPTGRRRFGHRLQGRSLWSYRARLEGLQRRAATAVLTGERAAGSPLFSATLRTALTMPR